jgi:FkbM family methyltransferase
MVFSHFDDVLRPARRLKGRIIKRRARAALRREQRRRAGFAQQASRITSHVAVEKDGALFFLPTREKAGLDRFAKREWKEKRHLERALETLAELGLHASRTTFVDVGAHVGTTAITAVRRFGFRSALAFEPELSNFRLLRANLGINGLEADIRTFNVAVSDRVGSAELALRPAIGSKHHLLGADETAGETVRVLLTTLDVLVAQGNLDPAGVGLLWLDVEGHELEVLRGAERLLERSVPIVMEFAPLRLLRNGRLASLRALLDEHYTHVVDLRPRVNGKPDIRPLEAVPDLARSYAQGFTDLLVFRLPSAVPLRAA